MRREYLRLSRILISLFSPKNFNIKRNFLYQCSFNKKFNRKLFGVNNFYCKPITFAGAFIAYSVSLNILNKLIKSGSLSCANCESNYFNAESQYVESDEEDKSDDDFITVTFNNTNFNDDNNYSDQSRSIHAELGELNDGKYVETGDIGNDEDLDTLDELETFINKDITDEEVIDTKVINKLSETDDVIEVTYITRPLFNDNQFSNVNYFNINNLSAKDFKLPKFLSGLFNIFNMEDNGGSFINISNPKNFFFYTCGAVFLMWAIAENSKNPRFIRFMNQNFIASNESVNSKRYHTLFTSGVSHSSFLHLTFNMMMLNMILDDFSKTRGASHIDFNGISNFFSNIVKGFENFPTYSMRNSDYVTNFDIQTSFWLSTLASTLGHSIVYRSPVLGASGGISGLMYLLATTNPNSTFKLIFPIPGLTLSALQIMQVFIATNLFFISSKKFHTNIAWSAHLFGVAAAIVYCWIQRNIFDRQYFKSFTNISTKYSIPHWNETLQEIREIIRL